MTSTHIFDTASVDDPSEEQHMPKDAKSELDCPVDATLRLLSGKWRLLVLFNLEGGPVRWGALKRRLSPITPRMLTATLRALEQEGLVYRSVEATIPPQVSYSLTEKGAGLAPVFEAMGQWGAKNLQRTGA